MNKFQVILLAMSFLFLGHTVEAQIGSNWTEVTPAAPWSPRNTFPAVVFNNQMWVLGGIGNSGNLNDVWSSPDGTNWTEVTPAAPWSPRFGQGAVVFNGKMWVLGGCCENNDVWSSSDGTNWTEVTAAAPWAGREEPGVVVLNGQIWVFGGSGGGDFHDVWSSSDGTNWTQVTATTPWSPQFGRNQFGAVAFNNQMWMLGGTGRETTNDVWSSLDGTNWTEETSAAAWSARYGQGAVVLYGKMWVFGGLGSSYFNDVWSSSDGTIWTQATAAAPWSARDAFGSVVFNNQMWVLGGSGSSQSSSYLNDVWSLTTTPPMASFSGTPTNGCAPLTVTFTDTSTGSITNWYWNFGDGGTTNLTTSSVVYTYKNGGVYTVTEIVTGPDGVSTNAQPTYITVSTNCPTVTAITKEGYNIRVTWTCFGGQSYALQSTKSTVMIAEYTTNFTDISPVIVASGPGLTSTNYLDVGAAYAPVLTAPGGSVVTTSSVPSTVDCSGDDTRGIADSLGNALPIGSLLMLGTFSISEPTIQSNFTAGNVNAVMSAFTPYTNSFAVGDGTDQPASWDVSLSARGFGGQQIYLLAIDKPTFAAATHLGIYTSPSWVFPADGNELDIDLADVTDFVIGAQGGSLTINEGLSSYTFTDTARLSVLPGRILFYRVRLAQ